MSVCYHHQRKFDLGCGEIQDFSSALAAIQAAMPWNKKAKKAVVVAGWKTTQKAKRPQAPPADSSPSDKEGDEGRRKQRQKIEEIKRIHQLSRIVPISGRSTPTKFSSALTATISKSPRSSSPPSQSPAVTKSRSGAGLFGIHSKLSQIQEDGESVEGEMNHEEPQPALGPTPEQNHQVESADATVSIANHREDRSTIDVSDLTLASEGYLKAKDKNIMGDSALDILSEAESMDTHGMDTPGHMSMDDSIATQDIANDEIIDLTSSTFNVMSTSQESESRNEPETQRVGIGRDPVIELYMAAFKLRGQIDGLDDEVISKRFKEEIARKRITPYSRLSSRMPSKAIGHMPMISEPVEVIDLTAVH